MTSSSTWINFKRALSSYMITCNTDKACSAPSAIIVDTLPLMLIGGRASLAHYRWSNSRLLLYVLSTRDSIVHLPAVSKSTPSLLLHTPWLRDACARFPCHKIVVALLDMDSFTYVGITPPVSRLSPLIMQSFGDNGEHIDMATRTRAIRRAVDESLSYTLVPGSYYDMNEAAVIEELSYRPVALPYRGCEAIVAPQLSITRLECKLKTTIERATDDAQWERILNAFEERQLAMMHSDGRLHVALNGDEDVSFMLVLSCVVARCLHNADESSLLRVRTMNAFVNFEVHRLSTQLFQRCVTSAAATILLRDEPTVRALNACNTGTSQQQHHVIVLPRQQVDTDVLIALEELNAFYVRTDWQVEDVFCVRNAFKLMQTLASKRTVLYRGDMYLTYHELPRVLSELYAYELERLALVATERYAGNVPEFLLMIGSQSEASERQEYFQKAFEFVRERVLRVQGHRVSKRNGGQVALPDIEDIVGQAAPLCMVNSLTYLKAEGRLPHHSRMLVYRHLLDAGYQRSSVEMVANKYVTAGGANVMRDHINTIAYEADKLNVDRDRKCGCPLMLSSRFEADKDSRGCPFKEHDERDLGALLIASGLDPEDPALPRIINKAVGFGDAMGTRHPRAACAMHATARIRKVVGGAPFNSNNRDNRSAFGGLPFDSPAEYIHHVLSSIQLAPSASAVASTL